MDRWLCVPPVLERFALFERPVMLRKSPSQECKGETLTPVS